MDEQMTLAMVKSLSLVSKQQSNGEIYFWYKIANSINMLLQTEVHLRCPQPQISIP